MTSPTFPSKYPRYNGYEPRLLVEDSNEPLHELLNEELRRIADALNERLPAYGQLFRVNPTVGFTSGATPTALTFETAFPSTGTVGVKRNLPSELIPSKTRGVFQIHWALVVEVDNAKAYTIELYVNGSPIGEAAVLTAQGTNTELDFAGGALIDLVEGDVVDIRVSSPGPTDTFEILSGTLFMTRIA